MREFLRRRFSREGVVGLSFTVSFLVCGAFAVLVGLMAHEVHEQRGAPSSVDQEVRQAVIAYRSPARTEAMLAVTETGDKSLLLLATPAVALTLWAVKRHVSALLFVGSVVGGFGVSSLLKIAIARARPDQWAAIVKETTYSFPSGHTTMATVFFGGLAAIVFHLTKKPLYRVLAVAGAGAVVIDVAISRVYLGAHWPTDTVAGMLTGLVWVVAYYETTETWERARAKRKLAEMRSVAPAETS
jgi:undecaprenyl-diphosphatase